MNKNNNQILYTGVFVILAMFHLVPRESLFAIDLVKDESKSPSDSTTQDEDQTILFVDDNAILYRSGTRRILQQPKRHVANPMISETKPWEVAIGYCTVYRDIKTGLHQCWYQSYSGNQANDPTRRVVVCYATSNEGVVWE